jgi:hypothetical protein
VEPDVMTDDRRFTAPWALSVRIITPAVCGILVAVSLIGATALPDHVPSFARSVAIILPLLVLAGTLPFLIGGYVLHERTLLIERLAWKTRIDLTALRSAVADPNAMRGSLRLFASGGLFGFFGWFRNHSLGLYRAYATDPRRAVVLKLSGRTVVVTPDDPDTFVAEVRRRVGIADAPPVIPG